MIFKDIIEDKLLGYYYSPDDHPDTQQHKLMESILQMIHHYYSMYHNDRFDMADILELNTSLSHLGYTTQE